MKVSRNVFSAGSKCTVTSGARFWSMCIVRDRIVWDRPCSLQERGILVEEPAEAAQLILDELLARPVFGELSLVLLPRGIEAFDERAHHRYSPSQ